MGRTIDIESAIASAEAETGTFKPGHAKIALIAKRPKRHRYWSKEDEKFLKENLGQLSIQQIGRHLGRSHSAVVNHYKREMHLPVSSKDPRVITGEQVALGLSKDGKSVHWMIDKGIMPGRRLAFDRQRVIRVVDKVIFLKWMLDPLNWCRFKPENVGEMKVGGKRRISLAYDQKFWDEAGKAIRKARRKWKDEWLTSAGAGRALGLKGLAGDHNINRAILKGNLKATRHQNWWIKRSDLPKTGTINAMGNVVPRILTRQELGKRNSTKFWADCYAGRRPWPNIGGHNKKVKEQDRFFKLLKNGIHAFQAARIVKVSNPTAYKWLQTRYGKKWQDRYPWTRERRKKRFFELLKKGLTIKKSADRADVNVESCYKWLQAKWGRNYKTKLRRMAA